MSSAQQIQLSKHSRNRPTFALLLALIAALNVSVPGFAANSTRKVTVAQLEQLLSGPGERRDADAAQQLSDLELTERLSPRTLARLKARPFGEQSSQQLDLLADRSAFLPLPSAETPATQAPDRSEQRRIMALAVNYVALAVHQMPNFLAERHTRSFVDRPDGLFAHQPLHLVGQSSSAVIYRDGREVDSPAARKAGQRKNNQFSGLVSSGEFGPILSNVLLDAARSELEWSHWETGANGEVAVFRYQVPAKQSHYDLRFSFGRLHQDSSNSLDSDDGLHWLPSYHGELAIDPASGAILRLTTVADLTPQDPLVMASIAVEYGPIEIGGKTYTCPVRSVALAQKHETAVSVGAVPSSAISQPPLVTLLNEVEFRDYHVFRGESRILTEVNSSSESDHANETEKAAGNVKSQPPAVFDSAIGGNAATTPRVISQPPSVAKSETESKPAVADSSPLHTHNEPSTAPDPAVAAAHPTPPPGPVIIAPDLPQAPVFKSTTHEVILDVVVSKKDGDPVTALSQQDFALSEDGKPQRIDFFEEHRPDEGHVEGSPQMPPLPAGAVSNVGPSPRGDAVNVLLLDALNTERADQSYVHTQITSFLDKLEPGTQVAIFLLGSKLQFVQGFTSDTAELIDALKRAGDPQRAQMAYTRSDSADDAGSIAMLQAMRASPAGIAALQGAQQAVNSYGYGARAAMTFEALDHIAHYLEAVPGRKNLIWFAGSFPVIFFPTAAQRNSIKQNPDLHGYMDQVKKTADLFTVSKIAVYPIGAQGVMSEHVMEADSPALGGAGNIGHAGSAADSTMSPFTAEAGERAGVIYAMEQLAASTGGKAFNNTNGLNDAMKRAINDGAHYYTVGYTPANPQADGTFRRIGVNVATGRYKLAYRAGYYADSRSAPQGAPATDPLAELLSFGLPNNTGILYAIETAPYPQRPDQSAPHLGENAALKGPLTRYRVDFTIRASDLEFVDVSGVKRAQALVAIRVFDADGNAVNWLAEMKTIDLAAAEFAEMQKRGLRARLEIDVPERKDLHLVTAVYDWSSRRNGTLSIPIYR